MYSSFFVYLTKTKIKLFVLSKLWWTTTFLSKALHFTFFFIDGEGSPYLKGGLVLSNIPINNHATCSCNTRYDGVEAIYIDVMFP